MHGASSGCCRHHLRSVAVRDQVNRGFAAPASPLVSRRPPQPGSPTCPRSIDARLAELGITLPEIAGAGGELRALRGRRQARLRLRPGQPRRAGPITGKLGAGLDVEAGARRRAHLRAGADRPARAPPAAAISTGWRGWSSSPASSNSAPDFTDQPEGGERRSDLMVEVFGDARPPRPLGGRGRRAAARGRGGDRRCLRDRLSCRRPSWTIPLAHRGLHDRARGIVENSRAAVRGRHRRRLRHRAGRPARRRRRGDGVPRRRDAAADRRARAWSRDYTAAAARRHRAPRRRRDRARRWPRSSRWSPGARRC